MERCLPHKGRSLMALLATFSFSLVFAQKNTQQLQTAAQNHNMGHALYKQTKLYDSKQGPVGTRPAAVGDRALDRLEYERSLIQNPYTKEIPKGIFELEQKFAKKLPKSSLANEIAKKLGGEALKKKNRNVAWSSRGPANVGGRTRAVALDVLNEIRILAGGVSGGMFRSTNRGRTWTQTDNRLDTHPSVTAIAQDPVNPRFWYYGGGERYGNSASETGAFYQGTGVFYSVNYGKTWHQSKSTNDGSASAFSSLDIINTLAVHPKTRHVYAGTFNGVFRSTDFGQTFEEVLPSAFDSHTEVVITPSGTLYASIDSRSGADAGFYVSENGTDWTNISPADLSLNLGRTVMTVDPSDENRLYFFASENPFGFEPSALLWRYQADAPEGEKWENLTDKLPTAIGGVAGDLNLQGAYNMVVKVHPTNQDIVFIGGTNLYRTTNGFATQIGREGWIGGYTNQQNSFALYPNHHPDQHDLVFLPSNPNAAISANDGGLFRTEDITADNVEWTSLNNGYLTTQPYAISIDPQGNSKDVLAGFQDNGTWFTGNENGSAPWISEFSGDGAFNAIADGGLTRYVSAQRGVVFRFNYNASGAFQSFSRVNPAGASGYAFVNPFILDHNNDNIMYMPINNSIWRNSNLDAIPLFSNAPATTNWSRLESTATPDGSRITGLDVSRYPVANRLYYGTSTGRIYKMENANIDGQEAVDVSTGKGLPTGNIAQIYVDPNDSDTVFAVFSNYGIVSLFMSKNAGNSWRSISGNLEENADGSGNGPSLRWFAISGNNDAYIVGTSTGLFVTDLLRGNRTRWSRERRRVISNSVIPQIRTRSDGYTVVADHGNGIYDGQFAVSPSEVAKLSVAYLLEHIERPRNSEPVAIDIEGLFVHSMGAEITIELTNDNPDLVTANLQGNTLTLSFAADQEGKAGIGLIATSGEEQVSAPLSVTVANLPIYAQQGDRLASTPSQNFLDFGGIVSGADDFIIPEGSTWNLERIVAEGGVNGAPTLDSANIIIYNDNNGKPGEVVYESGAISPSSAPNNPTLSLDFPSSVQLEGGTYWVSVYANLAFNGANQWFWVTQSGLIGNENHFRDEADLFGEGYTDWTPQSAIFGGRPLADHVFQLFGTVNTSGSSTDNGTLANGSDIEDDKDQGLAILDTKVSTVTWPNPSASEFNFLLTNSEDSTVKLEIFTLQGQRIFSIDQVDATKAFSWNAANAAKGVYVVKITGSSVNESFRIVKR